MYGLRGQYEANRRVSQAEVFLCEYLNWKGASHLVVKVELFGELFYVRGLLRQRAQGVPPLLSTATLILFAGKREGRVRSAL